MIVIEIQGGGIQVAAHSKNKNREDEQTSFSFWLSSLKAYGRRESGCGGVAVKRIKRDLREGRNGKARRAEKRKWELKKLTFRR